MHPIDRTIEAYRLDSGHWVVVGAWRDEQRARIQPFDAMELELAALWER